MVLERLKHRTVATTRSEQPTLLSLSCDTDTSDSTTRTSSGCVSLLPTLSSPSSSSFSPSKEEKKFWKNKKLSADQSGFQPLLPQQGHCTVTIHRLDGLEDNESEDSAGRVSPLQSLRLPLISKDEKIVVSTHTAKTVQSSSSWNSSCNSNHCNVVDWTNNASSDSRSTKKDNEDKSQNDGSANIQMLDMFPSSELNWPSDNLSMFHNIATPSCPSNSNNSTDNFSNSYFNTESEQQAPPAVMLESLSKPVMDNKKDSINLGVSSGDYPEMQNNQHEHRHESLQENEQEQSLKQPATQMYSPCQPTFLAKEKDGLGSSESSQRLLHSLSHHRNQQRQRHQSKTHDGQQKKKREDTITMNTIKLLDAAQALQKKQQRLRSMIREGSTNNENIVNDSGSKTFMDNNSLRSRSSRCSALQDISTDRKPTLRNSMDLVNHSYNDRNINNTHESLSSTYEGTFEPGDTMETKLMNCILRSNHKATTKTGATDAVSSGEFQHTSSHESDSNINTNRKESSQEFEIVLINNITSEDTEQYSESNTDTHPITTPLNQNLQQQQNDVPVVPAVAENVQLAFAALKARAERLAERSRRESERSSVRTTILNPYGTTNSIGGAASVENENNTSKNTINLLQDHQQQLQVPQRRLPSLSEGELAGEVNDKLLETSMLWSPDNKGPSSEDRVFVNTQNTSSVGDVASMDTPLQQGLSPALLMSADGFGFSATAANEMLAPPNVTGVITEASADTSPVCKTTPKVEFFDMLLSSSSLSLTAPPTQPKQHSLRWSSAHPKISRPTATHLPIHPSSALPPKPSPRIRSDAVETKTVNNQHSEISFSLHPDEQRNETGSYRQKSISQIQLSSIDSTNQQGNDKSHERLHGSGIGGFDSYNEINFNASDNGLGEASPIDVQLNLQQSLQQISDDNFIPVTVSPTNFLNRGKKFLKGTKTTVPAFVCIGVKDNNGSTNKIASDDFMANQDDQDFVAEQYCFCDDDDVSTFVTLSGVTTIMERQLGLQSKNSPYPPSFTSPTMSPYSANQPKKRFFVPTVEAMLIEEPMNVTATESKSYIVMGDASNNNSFNRSHSHNNEDNGDRKEITFIPLEEDLLCEREGSEEDVAVKADYNDRIDNLDQEYPYPIEIEHSQEQLTHPVHDYQYQHHVDGASHVYETDLLREVNEHQDHNQESFKRNRGHVGTTIDTHKRDGVNYEPQAITFGSSTKKESNNQSRQSSIMTQQQQPRFHSQRTSPEHMIQSESFNNSQSQSEIVYVPPPEYAVASEAIVLGLDTYSTNPDTISTELMNSSVPSIFVEKPASSFNVMKILNKKKSKRELVDPTEWSADSSIIISSNHRNNSWRAQNVGNSNNLVVVPVIVSPSSDYLPSIRRDESFRHKGILSAKLSIDL